MYQDFARYYDFIFPFKEQTFGFLASYVDAIPSWIMDLGCGTGQYLAEFRERGHFTVGIDNDAAMLKEAERNCPGSIWIKLDLMEIHRLPQQIVEHPKNLDDTLSARLSNGIFDLIFSTGNVLAYVPPERLEGLVAKINDLLQPGGTWLFQMVNWERVKGQTEFIFPLIKNEEKGLVFERRYQEITEESLLFKTRLTLNGNEVFNHSARLYLHPVEELRRLHYLDSWEEVGFYGNFKKEPYRSDSPAIIGVFRKRG